MWSSSSSACPQLGRKELLMWGVLIGLLVGLATDHVLVAAGA
jgi:hypothetical protein